MVVSVAAIAAGAAEVVTGNDVRLDIPVNKTAALLWERRIFCIKKTTGTAGGYD